MGSRQPSPGDFVRVRLPTLEVFGLRAGASLSGMGRTLTLDEIALARTIFGHSLRYDVIRIIAASAANSPTSLGNYVRTRPSAQLVVEPNVLMHELTHVWQFQTRGMGYLSNSLCHQLAGIIGRGDRNAAYRLTGHEIVAARAIDHLSAEKQAMLVEYWFADAEVQLSTPERTTTQWVAVRKLDAARAMLAEVRSAQPLPSGYALEEAAWGATMSSRNRAALGLHDPHDDLEHDADVPLLRIEF